MIDELEGICKEAVVAWIETRFWHLPNNSEENYEESESGQLGCRPQIEPRTHWILHLKIPRETT
jgi:hypothetical protein